MIFYIVGIVWIIVLWACIWAIQRWIKDVNDTNRHLTNEVQESLRINEILEKRIHTLEDINRRLMEAEPIKIETVQKDVNVLEFSVNPYLGASKEDILDLLVHEMSINLRDYLEDNKDDISLTSEFNCLRDGRTVRAKIGIVLL